MLLKEAIRTIPGLRFIIERLPLRSGFSRHILYDMPMHTCGTDIATELLCVAAGAGRDLPALSRLRDIRATLTSLESTAPDQAVRDGRAYACQPPKSPLIRGTSSDFVLDDIGLFEVKNLALLACDILGPELEPVVRILDPEGTRIPHFYIYEAYSDALKGEKNVERRMEIEDEIRVDLCRQLRPFAGALRDALCELAWLDIRTAKVQLATELGLCRPKVFDSEEGHAAWEFTALFNPEIAAVLREQNLEFQPVDIAFDTTPVLLTGANMSGKSVLLKTVALAQTLFQFGFYVPARSAGMTPVEHICIASGDGENTQRGLSSFGAEMMRIHEILQHVRGGESVLALIDEPARTTNPEEGRALAASLVELLEEHRVPSIVTTHYSGIACGRKLRTLDGYTLTEDGSETVPHEAIATARKLGIDPAWLDRATAELNRTE